MDSIDGAIMRTRILFSAAACLFVLGANAVRLDAQGTTSICKDGTTSAASGRGACSGHGGVDEKATSAAKKAAKSEAKKAAKTEAAAEKKAAAKTEAKADKKAAAKTEKAEAKREAKTVPSLPASVPATSPARAKSEAKSKAPSATKTVAGDNNDPRGATAQCKDGTYSHAVSHQGACSRHGGVAKFLKE